jgi:hypothetical protein
LQLPKTITAIAQKSIDYIAQAKQEISDETNQSKVLEFIQSVVVNKFSKLIPI